MIQKEMMTVVSHRMIAPNIFEMTMEGTLVSSMAMPGQFVHIKVSNGIDPLLRRPISICKIDPEQFALQSFKSGREKNQDSF